MKLSQRIKVTIATGLIVLAGGTAAAVQQGMTTGAEEPNPIIEQVGQHEERIGTLEGRADDTDAKVEKNSGDIQVIQQQTGAAPTSSGSTTDKSTPTGSPPATPVSPVAPTPAPEPPKNPRLITGVSDNPTTSGMHSCHYTLYDPGQNVTAFIQPVENACYSLGEVLPYF